MAGRPNREASAWRAKLSRFWGVPNLTWLQMPPYEIPGMAIISGVLIENRGRAAAQNVKIQLSYPADSDRLIHHMEVVSDEPYIVRGGGDRHSFVTLRLRALRPGGTVFIYYASHDQVIPDVEVTSYQKAAWTRVRATADPDDSGNEAEGVAD